MKLKELIEEVNLLYYADSKHWNIYQSKQKELEELMGASTDIKTINHKTILKYIEQLRSRGNSKATINSKLSYLNKLLTYAYNNELINHKPQLPYQKLEATTKRYITDPEKKAIEKYFKKHQDNHILRQLNLVYLIGLNTGLRISEIININLKTDIEYGYLKVDKNKTNSPTSIPLNKTMKDIIAALPEDISYPTTLDYHQLEYQWKKVMKELNIKGITLHSLRHTFCSNLVQKDVPLPVIQRLANHKSITTTMIYSHLKNEQLEKAVELL